MTARAFFLTFTFSLAPLGAARADLGHVAELGGHSHWAGLAALAAAAAVAAVLGLKSRAGRPAEEAPETNQGDCDVQREDVPGNAA